MQARCGLLPSRAERFGYNREPVHAAHLCRTAQLQAAAGKRSGNRIGRTNSPSSTTALRASLLDDPIVARKPVNPDPNLVNDGEGEHGGVHAGEVLHECSCSKFPADMAPQTTPSATGTKPASDRAADVVHSMEPTQFQATVMRVMRRNTSALAVDGADFQPTTAKERHWDTVDYATFW
jgi:hypothetical protein